MFMIQNPDRLLLSSRLQYEPVLLCMASAQGGEAAAYSDLYRRCASYPLPRMHHHDSNFVNHEVGSAAYGFSELEEAIALQETRPRQQPLYDSAGPPAATLEMFPSWPVTFQHQSPTGNSKSGEKSTTDSESGVNNTLSCIKSGPFQPPPPLQQPEQMDMASGSDSPKTGTSHSTHPATRQGSEKALRRLAQNREAARKSRLRKKAYVQQLESSRIRLAQLEQDLQRSRSQGLLSGGGRAAHGNISSGAAIFDMEYARWLDADHRHLSELRMALQAQLSDGDLKVILDGYIAHYDEIFGLKGIAAKSDVFHLITGMWATPAERSFLWMGGFRPSELIKMMTAQLDPLTDQQDMGIYGLQQSSQQAEEALTKGMDQLQQSLIEILTFSSINDNMHHMAVALGRLNDLEGFVRQADNLRQQTLHQLHRILTLRQSTQCFLAIGEYHSRLRALSSLWTSRPKEVVITPNQMITHHEAMMDLQQIMHSSHNHFSNF